jgi:hypothetical protein
MSTALAAQFQNFNGSQLPSTIQSLMSQMQTSELQENVGVSHAVVSFKGKVFRINFGGQETVLTVNMNGTQYAAPFMDVVIPRANAALSKTFYKGGYVEGSSDAPDCWSEDGIHPLAPVPVCHDCRLCPNNAFGSKINADTGKKGKACADTRKLVVFPVVPTGQQDATGNPITMLDDQNLKFGGPMLLRVPAASLSIFAEYDAKLNGMGIPYFAVVTRLSFDQTVAYPKFVLTPMRVLSESEAAAVVRLRDSIEVTRVLGSAHDSAPPVAALPAPVPTATPVAPTAPTPAAPYVAQSVPAQAPTPLPPTVPAPMAPPPVPTMPPPAPTPPPVPVAPPPPPTFPPAGWLAHPSSPGWFYCGQEVLSEADLRARTAMPAMAAPPQAPHQAPLPAVTATTGLMQSIDSLLQT